MLLTDLRHAWRALANRPGSSLATVFVFAVGIGLVTAIFALTDPYTLRPLPYADESSLTLLSIDPGTLPVGTAVALDDVRNQTELFQNVAAYANGFETRVLQISGATLAFSTLAVTSNYFQVLGVPGPDSGTFQSTQLEQDVPIVLTPRGRRALGADADVVGRSMLPVEGTGTLRIVGALPLSFRLPDGRLDAGADGVTPFAPSIVATRRQLGPRSFATESTPMVARLRPGVTLEAARRALGTPTATRPYRADIERVRDALTAEVRPLAVGALVAGLLILFTCAGNVANLLVVRASWRVSEFATREALGASRLDIARLWLVELGLVTTAALLAGLGIAGASLAATAGIIPAQYVTLGTPALTARVVVFAGIASLVVMLVALVAATTATGFAFRTVFGRYADGDRRTSALRVAFAGVQSALAMILAIGAALLVQSYANVMTQDVGYSRRALSVRVYSPARGAALEAELDGTIDRLRRIPGVLAAGASTIVLNEMTSWSTFTVNGEQAEVHVRRVTPGFFSAAGVRVRQGRELEVSDRDETIVVNEAFAKAFFPNGQALGQIVTEVRGPLRQVVGVVQDVFDRDFVTQPGPRIYARLKPSGFGFVYVVRVASDPQGYREAVRRTITDVNPRADLGDIDTIGRRLAETVRDRSFATLVLGFFGAAGVIITIAGLVAMVTFVVARRTREIAIRMACGASRSHIRRLVVREAAAAAVTGGVAGLFAGRWLSAWLEALVYGVGAANWTTPLVAGMVVLGLMIGASMIPARRAVNLEPMQALKE